MLGLARLLRLASIAICIIVAASFLVFAVDQTNNASDRQQQRLLEGSAPAPGPAPGPTPAQPGPGAVPATASTPGSTATSSAAPKAVAHEDGLHKALDEVADKLTSPFAGVVSSSSGEWAVRGSKLLFTLLVYGFGLGYLARLIRIRV